MKLDNAALLAKTHYHDQTRRHLLRNPPSRSQGFLLRPTFFLLRVFYRSLIFLIIIVGLSSYWLPLITGYKHLIETEASSYLGTQVTIGNVRYDIESEKPRWILNHVSLKDNKDKNKELKINELSMTLDLAETLRTIRVQPANIQASGVDVTVTQSDAGSFHVNGLTLPIAGFSSGAGREKSLYVDVTGGTAHWLNTSNNKQLDLYNLNFHGDIKRDQITANIHADLPKSVGKPLEITAKLIPDVSLSTPQSTESNYWTGDIKLSGEVNDPSALPLNIQKYTGVIDGDLIFNVDAKIEQNKVTTLNGQLVADHPVLEQALHTTHNIKNIYHQDLERFAINGRWEAYNDTWKALFSLEIEQNNNKQISNLSFENQITPAGFKLNASVDQIKLDRYLPLLERQQWLNKKIGKLLTELEPRGELTDFSLFLDVDTNNALKTELSGKGLMKNISIQAYKKIPALEKITAQFNFDKNSGRIKFSSENSKVNYQRWFDAPISIKELSALLSWKKTTDQWNFSLQNLAFSNEDAQLTGAGTLKVDQHNTPTIDLSLNFSSNRNIQSIKNYVPAFMPDKGKKWLKEAVKGGVVPKGGLKLKGDLKKFPFENADGGEFFTWFAVEKGQLHYLNHWPDAHNVSGKVIFSNEGMMADVTSATVAGNKITSGRVVIPNFKHNAELIISDLKTTGKFSKQVDYIRQSPLGKNLNNFLGHSKFSGKSDLALGIRSPLSKGKLKKENVSVDGKVNFHGVNANFIPVKQAFKKIRGVASFDQHGFSSKKLIANYKQSPVTVKITTSKDKKNIIAKFQQTNNIQRLIADNIDILKPYVKGKTTYAATLQLPSYSLKYPNKTKLMDLTIESNLEGISSNLPTPLKKQTNSLIPLVIKLKTPLSKHQLATYQIQYGKLLSAAYQYQKQRLGIVFGDKSATLPNEGVSIKGNITSTDLIQWKDIADNQGSISASSLPLAVELQINKLLLGSQSQGKAKLLVHNSPTTLTAKLSSERLQANIIKENNYWNIKLSNLNTDVLTAKQDPKLSSTLMPKQVPSLELLCRHCSSKGQVFDRLALQLQSRGNTSYIKSLDISGEDYAFSATGQWRSTQASTSQTQLTIKQATLDKPGNFIKRMGNDIGLRGGKTKITGQLSWQGSPIDFALRTLSGNTYLEMQKGRLVDVNVGVGKLLGLLNFSKLGRRLRFDFSDVSGKGVIFDQIAGNIQLDHGVLSTNDTIIKSSVMLAGISGKSDLVRKTHDQEITVIPDVKSALPVVGLVFGGIGLGATAAILDKLTDKSQTDQLKDEALGTRYHVTGSWAKPVIKDVTPIGAPEDIY